MQGRLSHEFSFGAQHTSRRTLRTSHTDFSLCPLVATVDRLEDISRLSLSLLSLVPPSLIRLGARRLSRQIPDQSKDEFHADVKDTKPPETPCDSFLVTCLVEEELLDRIRHLECQKARMCLRLCLLLDHCAPCHPPVSSPRPMSATCR